MIKKLIQKKHTDDDRGSTLVTVIVAISFVTILTSIILGTSLTSFRMKAIDRRAKDDFYYSEKALNDVYTGLGQKISVIAAKSYDKAFSAMGGKVGSENVKTAQKAQKVYKEDFVKETITWLLTNATVDEFQKFIVPAPGKLAYVTNVGGIEAWDAGEENIINNLGVLAPSKSYSDIVSVRVMDVSVICTDDNKDYKSEVVTDIVITVPRLDFFENNADIVDYAIIANKGIVVNGDVTFGASEFGAAPETFDGSNVYAGLSSSGGGLQINKGTVDFEWNYLVS